MSDEQKTPQPLIPPRKEGTGQKRSQERGTARTKKNPGKRPSQGG